MCEQTDAAKATLEALLAKETHDCCHECQQDTPFWGVFCGGRSEVTERFSRETLTNLLIFDEAYETAVKNNSPADMQAITRTVVLLMEQWLMDKRRGEWGVEPRVSLRDDQPRLAIRAGAGVDVDSVTKEWLTQPVVEWITNTPARKRVELFPVG